MCPEEIEDSIPDGPVGFSDQSSPISSPDQSATDHVTNNESESRVNDIRKRFSKIKNSDRIGTEKETKKDSFRDKLINKLIILGTNG